ncbi:hypothetical protein K505DRAFT_339590 [Melanomma pulvis-pyrius CBS 109.77]|uniref:Uncharacterized protein n=1 Tax=Melanomma pulvis-pyrius CBS 109.77 TaxID=1314802 RepID=A0A6A6X591_9PLEO|nr:hypothetical protein K505DRAFT_339590 [Melanomma pulvis-pyrius CBS 109.77]
MSRCLSLQPYRSRGKPHGRIGDKTGQRQHGQDRECRTQSSTWSAVAHSVQSGIESLPTAGNTAAVDLDVSSARLGTRLAARGQPCPGLEHDIIQADNVPESGGTAGQRRSYFGTADRNLGRRQVWGVPAQAPAGKQSGAAAVGGGGGGRRRRRRRRA